MSLPAAHAADGSTPTSKLRCSMCRSPTDVYLDMPRPWRSTFVPFRRPPHEPRATPSASISLVPLFDRAVDSLCVGAQSRNDSPLSWDCSQLPELSSHCSSRSEVPEPIARNLISSAGCPVCVRKHRPSRPHLVSICLSLCAASSMSSLGLNSFLNSLI